MVRRYASRVILTKPAQKLTPFSGKALHVLALLQLVFGILVAAIMAPLRYWAARERRTVDAQYVEAIQRGHSAAQEGASEEQLRARIEEWYKTLSFWGTPRKDRLIKCAQAAFAGVRHSSTRAGG